MILLGIDYGAVTGNMQAVTDAAFASAKDAVTLCITMTGMMALWVGVMEIARGAGLIRIWAELFKPCIHFLFPGIPKYSRAWMSGNACWIKSDLRTGRNNNRNMSSRRSRKQ